MPETDAAAIEAEIAWFTALLDLRFRIHGGEAEECDLFEAVPPPVLPTEASGYAKRIDALGLAAGERLVLILAALPHLRPQALDPLLIANAQSGRPFTEFGGIVSAASGFAPSWETALFLLAGEDMARRLGALALFEADAPLRRRRLLDGPLDETIPSAIPLRLRTGVFTWLSTGRPPGLGPLLQPLSAPCLFDDLALHPLTREGLEALRDLISSQAALLDRAGPGAAADRSVTLFRGPPGGGKRTAAAVVARSVARPCYRLDLSTVRSRPNQDGPRALEDALDRAEEDGAILLLDEADAVFGAGAAAALAPLLLGGIDRFRGHLVIACRSGTVLDPRLTARIELRIPFPSPDGEARLRMWQTALAAVPAWEGGAPPDWWKRAHLPELGMNGITNVLRAAALRAVREDRPMRATDVEELAAAEARKALDREAEPADRP